MGIGGRTKKVLLTTVGPRRREGGRKREREGEREREREGEGGREREREREKGFFSCVFSIAGIWSVWFVSDPCLYRLSSLQALSVSL